MCHTEARAERGTSTSEKAVSSVEVACGALTMAEINKGQKATKSKGPNPKTHQNY